MKRTTLILAVSLSACAGNLHDRALRSATAAKGVVDAGAEAWSSYVDTKIESCREKNLETSKEREDCLGVAAEAKTVAAVFESVRAMQLALYVALSTEEPNDEIKRALADLLVEVRKLKPYLDAARKK